ncbi:deoxyribodipyrimidine photo-lyase-like isoform X1 [Dinothrombium tinctorium]|uniref:Deoxyribodipyrimidine photo-lyase n=1 Tax=Dinothrombium tinctorium TaxID=1965070 RepID=A0A3S3S407_9ACAR|nr:deoxyribodipyrimidine photo-lyase-like isoform X1 [Dinothrombium tinctorium]
MSQSNAKRRKVEHRQSAVKVKQEVCDENDSDGDNDPCSAIRKSRSLIARSINEFNFNKKRVRVLSDESEVCEDCKSIIYWITRDARVEDNWSMLYAQRLSLKFNVPLYVCFCLVPKFLNATKRQYNFLLKGLQEVERDCHNLNIPFRLLIGEASQVLPLFAKQHDAGAIVTDFSPLRIKRDWIENLKVKLHKNIPICQVDAHNIVPCWVASPKLEYGARTIRKKIHDKLAEFLTHFPPVIRSPFECEIKSNNWDAALKSLQIDDETVDDVKWAVPGTEAGIRMLISFCNERLKDYASKRNNPNYNCLSNLSPWFHFGHLSVQRAILEVKKYSNKYKESVDAFIEEAIIRRELAENFCYYNDKYDSLEGAWDWAKITLKAHEKDKRPYIFSKEQLEKAQTLDPLWNAAQRQMLREGKMHGFLRMYWAKKILEWTKSPEEALEIAIFLNDKYNLDGRDPNGYVGCMWSICGVHDQGWAERPIFGKIRYMNYEGCKRKFDVSEFENKYKP